MVLSTPTTRSRLQNARAVSVLYLPFREHLVWALGTFDHHNCTPILRRRNSWNYSPFQVDVQQCSTVRGKMPSRHWEPGQEVKQRHRRPTYFISTLGRSILPTAAAVRNRPANKKVLFGVSLRFVFVSQGQVTFLFIPDIRKGRPLPPRFGGRECCGSVTRRLQPAATSNELPGNNNVETKHNVVIRDTCAYFIHAGHQPDPHRPEYLRAATEFKQSLLAIVYSILGTAVEDRVRRYRQSPITNANHKDTLTNVRSMRPAITDEPS